MKKALGKRATRRVYRAAPWIGAAVAVGVGSMMSRSRLFRPAIGKGDALLQPEHGKDA